MPKGNLYGVKSCVRKSVQRKPRFKGRIETRKQLEIRDSAQYQSETVDLQSGPTHHQTTTSQTLENVSGTEEAETSVSLRKITAASLAVTSLQSTPMSHSSSSHCSVTNFDQEVEGYRLIYVESMRKDMEEMHQFSGQVNNAERQDSAESQNLNPAIRCSALLILAQGQNQ